MSYLRLLLKRYVVLISLFNTQLPRSKLMVPLEITDRAETSKTFQKPESFYIYGTKIRIFLSPWCWQFLHSLFLHVVHLSHTTLRKVSVQHIDVRAQFSTYSIWISSNLWTQIRSCNWSDYLDGKFDWAWKARGSHDCTLFKCRYGLLDLG